MRWPPNAPYGFIRPAGHQSPKKGRNALLIAGCVPPIVVACFVGEALQKATQAQTPAVVFAPTHTVAIVESTPTSSGLQPIFAATLGGTPNDFTKVFGDPVTEGEWIASIAGHDVRIHADPAPKYSQDGQMHIYIVTVIGTGSWSHSSETTIAKRSLPPMRNTSRT